MRERLEELMELLNLNPTQFANAIGVQRATLQHILSGRNEPSLKIIMAIHSSFPDVELEWLLNGKGSAIPGLARNGSEEQDYPFLPGMENTIFPTESPKNPEFLNPEGAYKALKARKTRNNKDVRSEIFSTDKVSNKAVKEVVVFFWDGTYQKFSPELKK